MKQCDKHTIILSQSPNCVQLINNNIMLKINEINPLNVFGLRKVDYCSPHFTKITFDAKVQDKQLTDWIYENLQGRFWFGDLYCSVDHRPSVQKCAAFEIAAEASYFLLMLDQLNQHNF